MATRSRQLALHGAGPGTYTAYTVPSGVLTIVKEIVLFNEAGSATTVQLTAKKVSGQFCELFLGSIAADTALERRSWMVLEEGDFLEVAFGTGVIRWVMSGAELVA